MLTFGNTKKDKESIQWALRKVPPTILWDPLGYRHLLSIPFSFSAALKSNNWAGVSLSCSGPWGQVEQEGRGRRAEPPGKTSKCFTNFRPFHRSCSIIQALG